MTLYQVLHELQLVLAVILGACPLCTQPLTLDRLAAPSDQDLTKHYYLSDGPAGRVVWALHTGLARRS
jgi:hypothetical protein